MQKHIRITGAGFTTRRSAKRMLARRAASYVSDSEICMIEGDSRVKFAAPPRSSILWSAVFEVRVAPPVITDAFPYWPVLPTIGYDRRSAGGHRAAA